MNQTNLINTLSSITITDVSNEDLPSDDHATICNEIVLSHGNQLPPFPIQIAWQMNMKVQHSPHA